MVLAAYLSQMNFPPKVYVATDYHEFLAVKRTLQWAGFASVQYQELSNPGGRYVAVFYSDAAAAKNLIAATRRRLAEGQPAERPLRPAPVRPASE